MVDYQEICRRVCEIAREVGEYISGEQAGFSFSRVEFKGVQNMVSYVDKEAERRIVERLRLLIPHSGFITEEGTAVPGREEFKWVVDPLDGTTNYIHGLPPYCVSIALMHGEELVVGVIYEITLGEMFYSWKGANSYLNDAAIHVSGIDTLEHSLIGAGFSYPTNLEVSDFLDLIAYFQKNTNGIRRLGSAAADLAYVACGRFDGFYHVRLAPWDVAAGALIVRNAGGVVKDYSGGNNFIFGREIIASNPYIYPQFSRVVRSNGK